MAKMIYSESNDEMVKYGFVRKYSVGDEVIISKVHFTWCDDDMVYYSDDTDEVWYEEYQTEQPYIDWNWGRCKRVDFIWDEDKTA